VKRLVLAGAGHAHALVLAQWAARPVRGVELVVVSPEPLAPYSGMVPGWLAGLYRFDEIAVDFPALALAAGARWLPGEVQAMDPAMQRLVLADGSTLAYDRLSLNLGATLRPPPTRHAQVLPLRPLAQLHRHYGPLLERWAADRGDRAFVVTAVGGGAAGLEALLAVVQRLRRLRPDRVVQGRLLSRSTALLPGLSAAARRAAQRALARAGVAVHLGSGWNESVDLDSDVVLWATGAEAHDWQCDPARRGALAVDEAGFIRINAQLQSVSHPQVFATGDCASWPGHRLPKAGVHAVRMAPVLGHNLRVALGVDRGAFKAHQPQRQVLALLATGDGRAIASRGPFGAEGAWAWRWKDRIDRRFLARFLARFLKPGRAKTTHLAADVTAAPTGDSP